MVARLEPGLVPGELSIYRTMSQENLTRSQVSRPFLIPPFRALLALVVLVGGYILFLLLSPVPYREGGEWFHIAGYLNYTRAIATYSAPDGFKVLDYREDPLHDDENNRTTSQGETLNNRTTSQGETLEHR